MKMTGYSRYMWHAVEQAEEFCYPIYGLRVASIYEADNKYYWVPGDYDAYEGNTIAVKAYCY